MQTMQTNDAVRFLAHFGPSFDNETVRSWVWTDEDGDFGKRESWDVATSASLQTIASVDLGLTQLQLSITERDASGEADERVNDAVLVFDALVSFEDRTVTLNGDSLGYTEASIREVISAFNERG